MMNSDEFTLIGQIRKTFGYRGEIILEITSSEAESFKNLQSVFLDFEGARIPFLIEYSQVRPDQSLLVKFKQVASREDAIKLLHRHVYIPAIHSDEDVSIPDDDIAYEDLLGFLVRDVHQGDIGQLKAILEYPDQDIMSIDAEGIEVLIPLVDAFILEVDPDKRLILLDTPEGLIDIYLHPDAY